MENQLKPEVQQERPPRVVIFPLPAQGHVNSMLKLAELLSLAGINVTFLNTDHLHNLLLRHADVETRFAAYPGFEFKTISDGLPDDHSRSTDSVMEVLNSMNLTTKPVLKEMLVSGVLSNSVTCIIVDGAFTGFATDLAVELDIPIIHFRTVSACCIWNHFCVDRIIEAGGLPIRGNYQTNSC